MTTALTFHNTHFDVIEQDNKIWLTASQIGTALGYKSDDAISRIYRRNSDEFSSGMTETVKLTASGNYQKTVRVFSLRGAHLIAMFAKTQRAKEFRHWVLNVLDKETNQANPTIHAGMMEVDGEEFLVLTKDQALHMQRMMNNVDALEREEAKTQQEITLLRNRLHTVEAVFDEMKEQLNQFERHQSLKIDRIRHFHLHRHFVLQK